MCYICVSSVNFLLEIIRNGSIKMLLQNVSEHYFPNYFWNLNLIYIQLCWLVLVKKSIILPNIDRNYFIYLFLRNEYSSIHFQLSLWLTFSYIYLHNFQGVQYIIFVIGSLKENCWFKWKPNLMPSRLLTVSQCQIKYHLLSV